MQTYSVSPSAHSLRLADAIKYHMISNCVKPAFMSYVHDGHNKSYPALKRLELAAAFKISIHNILRVSNGH
eukprot:6172979-Pleurochrysis_carterae.AAC.1